MTEYPDPTRKKAGWCPLTGTLQTALTEPAHSRAAVDSQQPDGGSDDSHKRINRGAGIAVQSIKTLIHNKQLLWFSFLAGLVVLFMFLVEVYLIIYSISSYSSYTYWSIGYKPGLVLIFAIEMVSIFCLNFLLAGLLLSFQSDNTENPGKILEGLSRAKSHVQSIAGWSFILALPGTAIYTIGMHHPYFKHFYPAMGSIIINIPFVYYIPDILLSAINFVIIKMSINVLLFVLTMSVIPLLVLENRSLFGAVTGIAQFFRKIWMEAITCFLIFCLILLGISLIAPLIDLSPFFVDYDYHFFSVHAIEMAAVCILFLLGWWTAAVTGFSVAGIAVMNLYNLRKTRQISGEIIAKSKENHTK